MKATVMRVSLSFLLTTILSLLFTATITSRLFTSISFVTITMLCENMSYSTINRFLATNIENDTIPVAVFNSVFSLSDFYCLIFVLLVTIIFRKIHISLSIIDISAIVVIPVISLIILITPDIFAFNKTNPRAYSNLINLLLTINIVNFFLINEISKKEELQAQTEQLSRQIEFQQNKYVQLGEAYKSLRSFMHDTNKHFIYIQLSLIHI